MRSLISTSKKSATMATVTTAMAAVRGVNWRTSAAMAYSPTMKPAMMLTTTMGMAALLTAKPLSRASSAQTPESPVNKPAATVFSTKANNASPPDRTAVT